MRPPLRAYLKIQCDVTGLPISSSYVLVHAYTYTYFFPVVNLIGSIFTKFPIHCSHIFCAISKQTSIFLAISALFSSISTQESLRVIKPQFPVPPNN